MKNLQNILTTFFIKLKRISDVMFSPHYFPALLGIIGAVIIIISTSRFNAGVTPDSVVYLAAARNIANGNGMSYIDGSPIISEPPLFPIILAVINYVLKIDPLLSARFVNAILFGLIIYLSGLLFTRHLKSSPALVLLGATYVLFSYSLFVVSLMVWTEPLFICFVLLFIIFSERYFEKGDTISIFFLSLAITFASLTRYAGIFLIPIGIIYILFLYRENLVTKVKHLFLFGLVSILPFTVVLIRNYIISGSLIGYNPTAIGRVTFYQGVINLFHVVKAMFINVLSWFLPWRIINNPLLMFILSMAICLFVILMYKENWKKRSNLLQVFPLLLFVTIYTGSLLVLVGPSDKFEDRYLSPIFVPVILLLFIIAVKLIKPQFIRLSHNGGNILFMAIMAVGLIHPTRAIINLTINQMEKGSGYTSEAWSKSETIHYLLQHRTLESDCKIYSDREDTIYLLTGIISNELPDNTAPGGILDISQLNSVSPTDRKLCLVVFDNIKWWRSFLIPPEDLKQILISEKTIRLQDGTIYFIPILR